MSDCSCEYITYTQGRVYIIYSQQNVIPVQTVITPSPGTRQLILFALPMKFCTQMLQNRDPRRAHCTALSAAQVPSFFFVFFGASAPG